MLNSIWLAMILISIVCATLTGRLPEVVVAVTDSAKMAFELSLALGGIIVFWLGLMHVAKDSGLISIFARLLAPLTRRLFPAIPPEHPAMNAIIMNFAANMLGLNNAATPLGLKAMIELKKLNKFPGVASDAMCTFLVINTSNITLINVNAIALLAAAGSTQPTIVIGTTLLATICSTGVGVIAVKWFAKWPYFSADKILPQPDVREDNSEVAS